jgi:hypothetical protein
LATYTRVDAKNKDNNRWYQTQKKEARRSKKKNRNTWPTVKAYQRHWPQSGALIERIAKHMLAHEVGSAREKVIHFAYVDVRTLNATARLKGERQRERERERQRDPVYV